MTCVTQYLENANILQSIYPFRRNCAHYSSARPPPIRSTKFNDDQNNNNKGSDTSDTSDFKPVNLSYRALECRGVERDCPTKSPLIIHHSLFGRKENWNPISEVCKSPIRSNVEILEFTLLKIFCEIMHVTSSVSKKAI